jgi:hypothetical protein
MLYSFFLCSQFYIQKYSEINKVRNKRNWSISGWLNLFLSTTNDTSNPCTCLYNFHKRKQVSRCSLIQLVKYQRKGFPYTLVNIKRLSSKFTVALVEDLEKDEDSRSYEVNQSWRQPNWSPYPHFTIFLYITQQVINKYRILLRVFLRSFRLSFRPFLALPSCSIRNLLRATWW